MYGDGDGDGTGYAETEAVRSLLRSWAADAAGPAAGADGGGDDSTGDDDGYGTGLDVPPAAAGTVIAAVARLLGLSTGPGLRPSGLSELTALSGLPAERFAELRLLALALVVDEHPSAPRWAADDRLEAASWVAVLIERDGEDGVTTLVDALRRN
ncbi:hypothetical protein [Streptomyces sp. NPDC090025]|uniref:hypothetical protein n=1 Tax=Streptomyces sp. NPDC090025 TaxID=3365922 RepID=UPI003832F981